MCIHLENSPLSYLNCHEQKRKDEICAYVLLYSHSGY